uniref:Uncharacterized protein n=1 Tax=Strongyloides papillosus TaxID=174720 RepID=A0A0N5BVI8_STREA
MFILKMRQIKYFYAFFLFIFISQLCSPYKVTCVRKYFSWRCFLFISLNERVFRKKFLKFIPKAEQKIILLKAEREKFNGFNHFPGTNLYICIVKILEILCLFQTLQVTKYLLLYKSESQQYET